MSVYTPLSALRVSDCVSDVDRAVVDAVLQNIDLDYHWPGAQTARVRAVADEIIASHPNLVLSRSTVP